jgi:hypothetical protein
MDAIRRFWAKSVLNKVTLLMSFSLVFCCCGWSGRIGQTGERAGGRPSIERQVLAAEGDALP